MKTACPFCGEVYDVNDEFRGQKAVCSVCEKTFRVPGKKISNHSEPADSKAANPVTAWLRDHRKRLTWAAAGLVILLTVLLTGGYYLLPNKWRAINTRADLMYAELAAMHKIIDEDEVWEICKQRAELEYKTAENDRLDDIFIAFWCDRKVTGYLSDCMEELKHRAENESHDEPIPQELKDREKDFKRHIEKEHPQNKELKKVVRSVEEDCTPAEEILLKYRHIRPYILVRQDEKYSKTSDLELLTLARKKLENALFNCFRTTEKIRYPDALRGLCKSKAAELIKIDNSNELERDFALLILSDEFDRRGKDGLNKTTSGSFYWLMFTTEKYIPNGPFSWQIKDLMSSSSDFREKYDNLAEYGRSRSRY